MSQFSTALLADHEDIRHIHAAFRMSKGVGRDILVDDIRWRTTIHLVTKEIFVYPVMEEVSGSDTVAKDRALFAPAKDIIKQLDRHIEERPREPKPGYLPVVDPAAYADTEKLWEALVEPFAQVKAGLPAFESKLTPEQSSKLFHYFDLTRTSWTANLATPWGDRPSLFWTGGEMLDTPPQTLRDTYAKYFEQM